MSEEGSVSSSHDDPKKQKKKKKKRSQPGTPDPAAQVVAMSPRSLMATNRFVCEVCGKGFQRDQNLQLHMRGHNLPWSLRQRNINEGKEAEKKRVYVCPEPSCVHHHPSRALGDLTGVKKHYCRKHGEKRWKCDKCSKKYAVFSDWKAHDKTCGSKQYTCDCGTLFSRKDSFITHRAFCDALAEESARIMANSNPAAACDAPTASLLHHPLFPSFPRSYNSNPNPKPNTDPTTSSFEEPTPGDSFQPLFIPYFSGHHHQHAAVTPPRLPATMLLQKATNAGHLCPTTHQSIDFHASTSQRVDGTRNFLGVSSSDSPSKEHLPLPFLGMDVVTLSHTNDGRSDDHTIPNDTCSHPQVTRAWGDRL